MDNFADAMMENLPERLARDVAEHERLLLSRSRTSRPSSRDQAYETQRPHVPQPNPSCLSHRFHQGDPETFLCPLRQNSVESTCMSESEALLKSAACHCPPSRALRRGQSLAPTRYLHMKQETELDVRRLFLNGLDEDWGSDSSADAETGLSSPSVRTRKQSITTAATSVDLQLHSADKVMEELPTEPCSVGGLSAGNHRHGDHHPVGDLYPGHHSPGRCHKQSFGSSPENQAEWLASHEGGSWVDLGEHDLLHGGDNEGGPNQRRHGQGTESPQQPTPGLDQSWASQELHHNSHQPGEVAIPNIPRRRSSLSHQVTTVMLGETSQSPKSTFHQFPQEPVSQPLLPSPPTSPRHTTSQHLPGGNWAETEAGLGPDVPIGRHQDHRNLQLDLSAISPPDQLSLPPLSATETMHHDRFHHDRSFSLRSQHQHPNLLTKPRKSHSITKRPLRNVHHWLESSSRSRQLSPSLTSTSPVAMSPTSSVRVSGPVLEALRINVQNFPDTMLRTSSVTIDQIRDYSHKVRRSDATRQLVPARESDELASMLAPSPSSVSVPALGRKTSLGNLKRSLRGKFSRFTTSTSASIDEQNESDWPPMDDAATGTVRCESPPLRATATRDAACINALRCILPRGTPYLLDALYAHIIAYNYIDSLCGSLSQLHQNGEGPPLRPRPSKNVMLPPGVTSLADLRVQEDVSDTVVKEFQDDMAGVTSRAVVPSKAASLLGLGSTNMGKPMKPSPGPFAGRDNKPRKASPPGAFKGHYLESDSAMRSLREDIAHNIQRLVDTAESCASVEVVDSEEVQDSNIVRHNGKQLEPILMRALSEVVRCYEELSC